MKRLLTLVVIAGLAACNSPENHSPATKAVPVIDPNPIILTLAGQNFHWKEFETFLKFDLDTLPSEESKRKAWIDNGVNKWTDELMMVNAAESSHVQVSESEYRTWLNWVREDGSEKALEEALEQKGLSLKEWEAHERGEFLIKSWVEATWPLSAEALVRDAQSYYFAHPDEFTRPEEIRIRQLVTDSREKAEGLRTRILAGESFAKLAIDYSQSPDRMNGGDLGFFARGELPASFEDVCFSLPIGSLSPVVKSEYGYHLFKVLDRRLTRVIPFEKAKGPIVRQLRDEWVAKNTKQWLDKGRKDTAPNPKWGVIHEYGAAFLKTRKAI